MTAPQGYKHATVVPIRYGDMDALGHVNNAKYLTYIEHARATYMGDLGLWDGQSSQFGLIVARITVDYKLPLVMADGNAVVWTRCSRLGTKSLDLEAIILRERDGAVAAVTQTVGVCYDYTSNATIPLPMAWREQLVRYEPILEEQD